VLDVRHPDRDEAGPKRCIAEPDEHPSFHEIDVAAVDGARERNESRDREPQDADAHGQEEPEHRSAHGMRGVSEATQQLRIRLDVEPEVDRAPERGNGPGGERRTPNSRAGDSIEDRVRLGIHASLELHGPERRLDLVAFRAVGECARGQVFEHRLAYQRVPVGGRHRPLRGDPRREPAPESLRRRLERLDGAERPRRGLPVRGVRGGARRGADEHEREGRQGAPSPVEESQQEQGCGETHGPQHQVLDTQEAGRRERRGRAGDMEDPEPGTAAERESGLPQRDRHDHRAEGVRPEVQQVLERPGLCRRDQREDHGPAGRGQPATRFRHEERHHDDRERHLDGRDAPPLLSGPPSGRAERSEKEGIADRAERDPRRAARVGLPDDLPQGKPSSPPLADPLRAAHEILLVGDEDVAASVRDDENRLQSQEQPDGQPDERSSSGHRRPPEGPFSVPRSTCSTTK
jgi:hypothetical protein